MVLINYDLVLEKFNEGMLIKEIANEIKRSMEQISAILKEKGVSQEDIFKRRKQSQSRPLIMLDKQNNIIKQFDSVSEAAQYCIEYNLSKDTVKGISSHISQCCNGIRKSAYKHIWKYISV